MLKLLKQARAAIGLLNPDEVRQRAGRPVRIGLVATDGKGYGEMEDFLVPRGLPRNKQWALVDRVYRADDPGVPASVDIVLFQQDLATPEGAYTFHRDEPERTIVEILRGNEDFALPLARQFPAFRRPVVERIIHSIARENALFAVATALPDVIPSLIELPWAFGEFATDTAFLTANQVRMAFLIAAACGKEIGFSQQKGELVTIAAGAFGWRAIARELAGKIPFGGGLVPKGAIAYAGTFVVGKSLELYHRAGAAYTSEEREQVYQQAFRRGEEMVQSLRTGEQPVH